MFEARCKGVSFVAIGAKARGLHVHGVEPPIFYFHPRLRAAGAGHRRDGKCANRRLGQIYSPQLATLSVGGRL
jgi:hypothetical protein